MCVCPAHSPAETAMKARREIADYMKSGRLERARIRVSHHTPHTHSHKREKTRERERDREREGEGEGEGEGESKSNVHNIQLNVVCISDLYGAADTPSQNSSVFA